MVILHMLKIAAFLLLAVVAVKLVRRFLFPEEKEPQQECERLPEGWKDMPQVTPEDLQPGDVLLRLDDLELIYMRKAEKDEYREGVDEWLFHPPGSEKDYWVGMVREDFNTVRLLRKAGDHE